MGPTSASFGLGSEALQSLRALIQLNIDCRDSFLAAREHLNDDELRLLTSNFSKIHDQHATSLKNLLWANQADPRVSASFSASAGRVWTTVRAAFGKTRQVILTEAMRMEQRAAHAYGETLETIEGRAVRQILREQLRAIQLVKRRLQELVSRAANN